jgi:metal-dependent amidase/aminoacylase/carboxypeptidase family protein
MIRVHPIITGGGDMVNAIPETVRLESYVRGSSFEAIESANKKVNRALTGAALSIGANIEIIDIPGYAPHRNSEDMRKLSREAFEAVLPDEALEYSDYVSTGSTDMGDLSCVMPVIHPYAGGATGKGHGNDYKIADPERACVSSAKWQLAIVKLLLENDAQRAKKIIADFKPLFASKEEYFAYVDKLNLSGDRIEYNLEEGTATVKI